MNQGLASVERISAIRTHPNADALDIATVLGYECVIRRDSYREGDMIVLIQPDTVLPQDREWAQEYLAYAPKRVKAIRLRGEWSMGIVAPLSILDGSSASWAPFESLDARESLHFAGEEVGEALGITKYEPPLPRNVQAIGGLPFGIPKTDEDRWQNVRDLDRYFGEPVDVTLKIDGSSFTAYCVLPGHHAGDEICAGITSRTQELRIEDEISNPWLEAARKTDVLTRLAKYCAYQGVSLALRGEVYGQGVQAMPINPYSRKPRGVGFFSVWNIAAHRYEGRDDPHYFAKVCAALDLPTVPILGTGVPLSQAMINVYDRAESYDGEPFEGVVIKGDGFSFKVVNKHYDAKK